MAVVGILMLGFIFTIIIMEGWNFFLLFPLGFLCITLLSFTMLFKKDSVWYSELKYVNAKQWTRMDFKNMLLYVVGDFATPFDIKYKNRNFQEFEVEYFYNRKKEFLYKILWQHGKHKYTIIEPKEPNEKQV
jgi:hypothetical protein